MQEARKVTMKAFILADEHISKAETRHKATLLEPADGAKRSREEDAFSGSKSGKKALGKSGGSSAAPLASPDGFFLCCRQGRNSIKKIILAGGIVIKEHLSL